MTRVPEGVPRTIRTEKLDDASGHWDELGVPCYASARRAALPMASGRDAAFVVGMPLATSSAGRCRDLVESSSDDPAIVAVELKDWIASEPRRIWNAFRPMIAM